MNKNSEIRLRQILVVTSVVAYAIACIADIALAFSSGIDAGHAAAAAGVMVLGAGVTLFFGRHGEFMGGPLLKDQPVALAFAAGVWVNLVLAAAGGIYPLLGVGRFISFMGYVGSIAFIPPVLAGAVMLGIDRLGKKQRR